MSGKVGVVAKKADCKGIESTLAKTKAERFFACPFIFYETAGYKSVTSVYKKMLTNGHDGRIL